MSTDESKRERFERLKAAYEAGTSMAEIARGEGITRERVRQILNPSVRPTPRRVLVTHLTTPTEDVQAVITAAEMVHDWWTTFRGDSVARDRVLGALGESLEGYWKWANAANPEDGGHE